jgi:type II secretory pathway component HofQ
MENQEENLNKFSVKDLKKVISAYNLHYHIRNYSKQKKNDLIQIILNHMSYINDNFHNNKGEFVYKHVLMKNIKEKKEPKQKEEKKEEEKKEEEKKEEEKKEEQAKKTSEKYDKKYGKFLWEGLSEEKKYDYSDNFGNLINQLKDLSNKKEFDLDNVYISINYNKITEKEFKELEYLIRLYYIDLCNMFKIPIELSPKYEDKNKIKYITLDFDTKNDEGKKKHIRITTNKEKNYDIKLVVDII